MAPLATALDRSLASGIAAVGLAVGGRSVVEVDDRGSVSGPGSGAAKPPGSPPHEVCVRTEDGWTLRGQRLPRPDARVVVVCGHAMMVDRRTLDRPAGRGLVSTLWAGGLEVVWVDVRGHGQSGPTAAQGGRWSYDDIVRHDVPAMVALGRRLAAGRPVVLLGHSLVGHAAMIAAGQARQAAPDALVAYAPNLWAPHLEPRPSLRVTKAALLAGWDAVSRARGFFDAPGLGLGTDAEAADYVRQFLTMWREDRLFGPSGAYTQALAAACRPMLVVSSRRDRLFARPESVRRFAELCRLAPITYETLPVAGVPAPDHMGFVTDPRSRPLWERTAAWIRRTVS